MLYKKSKTKNIISDKDRLNDIVYETLKQMADVTGRTLGPCGRPVLIDRGDLAPLVTKDGVTVIKSMGIAEAEKNIVLDAAKEIAIGTANEAGDGTTTAIVIANAIVQNGQKFLAENPRFSPQKMINELDKVHKTIITPFLKEKAIKVENEQQLLNVATISANGDTKIAEVVVNAVMAAGEDGKVLIQEGQGDILKLENVDGFVVTSGLRDLGQIGPVFINDKANQQVNLDNGHVLLYDGALNDLHVPAKLQDAVADEAGLSDGRPILVFAHSFADNVLDKFAKTTKGGVTVLPIKTPRSGLPNGASMFLHDMAAYTGGTVFDVGTVDNIDELGLGGFESAKVNMYESFVIGSPEVDAIQNRVTELKSIMNQAFGEMDRSMIRASIAKLTGGISTIWVGGTSDLEIREKKDRVEDAENAVRSAIAEGIVPGGGTTLLTLSRILDEHPDKKPSWNILIKAFLAPVTLLIENCGEDAEVIVEKLYNHTDKNKLPDTVFDANEYTYVDPFTAGIIEPAKVCRVSIGNALSVAGLLTTLGGIVCIPRQEHLENQMEIADKAFSNMMNSVGD